MNKRWLLRNIRYLFYILLFVLLILFFIHCSHEVLIYKNSEKAITKTIAQQLGKKDLKLSVKDYQRIESLVLDDLKITDLKPLIKCANLKSLKIINSESPFPLHRYRRGPVARLRTILGLSNYYLIYKKSRPVDIRTITKLSKLEEFSIQSRQIKNHKFLSGLKNLQNLELSRTEIKDIKLLQGLTNLKCIRLTNILIDDITPLANLKNLQVLSFSDSVITNILPLANLKSLQLLILKNTIIDDEQITELQKTLPNLKIEK